MRSCESYVKIFTRLNKHFKIIPFTTQNIWHIELREMEKDTGVEV